jgi:hypothetical protein
MTVGEQRRAPAKLVRCENECVHIMSGVGGSRYGRSSDMMRKIKIFTVMVRRERTQNEDTSMCGSSERTRSDDKFVEWR